MRHNKAGRQLGRNASHRKAMFRNMVTSLFEHGKIRTTDAKAKEVRRIAEKLITLGKRGDLHARRRALSYVRSREVVEKLFDESATQFATRPGGYTRITKLGNRRGDNAPVSIIELVEEDYAPKKAKKAKPAAKKKAAAKKAAPKATPAEDVVEVIEAKEAPAEEAAPVEEVAKEAASEEEKTEE